MKFLKQFFLFLDNIPSHINFQKYTHLISLLFVRKFLLHDMIKFSISLFLFPNLYSKPLFSTFLLLYCCSNWQPPSVSSEEKVIKIISWLISVRNFGIWVTFLINKCPKRKIRYKSDCWTKKIFFLIFRNSYKIFYDDMWQKTWIKFESFSLKLLSY